MGVSVRRVVGGFCALCRDLCGPNVGRGELVCTVLGVGVGNKLVGRVLHENEL